MPPSPAADRNLLFGILDLQTDFAGRDALIAATPAPVLDKPSLTGGSGVVPDRLYLLPCPL
jgi:hypothetical protein